MAQNNELTTSCCIAGGGPAGMMLGFLLARAGIDVIVLEKHADFFRDFRGDTIHPSTFQLMFELDLLEEFLKVPHQEIETFSAVFNNEPVQIANFRHLNVVKPALGLMPQWDFLKFLQKQAERYPTFRLVMNAEVTGVISGNGRINGVTVSRADGENRVLANLVVAADGRRSILREKANLKVISSGVPIDVLWFRVSRLGNDPAQILGRFNAGRIMVMLDRNDYWQCAYIIKKGGDEHIRQQGIQMFRHDIELVAPFLAGRLEEVRSWDDIKLLTVDVDHLETWYTSGLLCIGDAAHAMSPVGGVGINLAIQDAVAAANMLHKSFKEQGLIEADLLRAVQKRRSFPTRFIQQLQILLHNKVIQVHLTDKMNTKPPIFMRLLNAFPILQRLPARVLGVGVRPEHIHTPDTASGTK